jgi:hypothetical protein
MIYLSIYHHINNHSTTTTPVILEQDYKEVIKIDDFTMDRRVPMHLEKVITVYESIYLYIYSIYLSI